MKHYFQRVAEVTPTRFWINNVTREEAALAISEGAIGCTQNPSYTWKMLTHPTEKEFAVSKLDEILKANPSFDNDQILCELQKTLVGNIANTFFMPLYESSCGKNGYVSIQGNPFREDTETIIQCALQNHEAAPNIMAKVPVTKEGLEAIEYLSSKKIPINATEVMSVQQAMDVGAAYRHGTQGIANPAPIFYSHITGILDEYFKKAVAANGIKMRQDTLWQAGIACAKKTYHCTKAIYPELGFIGGGARGLHHFTEMVGAEANITINWKGTAEDLIKNDPIVVSRFLQPVPENILDELIHKVPDFKQAYFLGDISPEEYEGFGPVVLFRTSFETAWKNALNFIEEYRK